MSYNSTSSTNRNQQIASLLRTVPSAANRSPHDNSIFDVGIRLADSKILTLRTELPIDFPRVPPILRILDPGAQHPWLDPSGRLAEPADLYSWDERTSDLGQVVQKALTEFCTRPPHINPALMGAQKVKTNWTGTLPAPIQQQSSQRMDTSSQNTIQLTIPDNFPEISNMDQKQLQELLENESLFAKLFESIEVFSNALQLRDSVRKGNIDKANENTAISKEVSNLQTKIESLNKQLSDVRQTFSSLLAEQRSISSPLEPKKLAEGLEYLARQTDAESEEVARKLFDDPAQLEANLNRFRSQRIQYHLKRAKADRCRAQFS
jgi:regulator of replication initiation timing